MEGSPKPSEAKTKDRGKVIDHAVLAQKVEFMHKELLEAKEREQKLKVSYFDLLNKYHTLSDKDSTSLTLQQLLKPHKLGLDAIAGPNDYRFREHYSNSLERSVNTELSDFVMPQAIKGPPVPAKYYSRDDQMRSSRSAMNLKKVMGQCYSPKVDQKSAKNTEINASKLSHSKLRMGGSGRDLAKPSPPSQQQLSNNALQGRGQERPNQNTKAGVSGGFSTTKFGGSTVRIPPRNVRDGPFDHLQRTLTNMGGVGPGLESSNTSNCPTGLLPFDREGLFGRKVSNLTVDSITGCSPARGRDSSKGSSQSQSRRERDSSNSSSNLMQDSLRIDSRRGSAYKPQANTAHAQPKLYNQQDHSLPGVFTNLSGRLKSRAALKPAENGSFTPKAKGLAFAPSSAFSRKNSDKENSEVFHPGLKLGVEINRQGSPLSQCYMSGNKSRCNDYSRKNTPSIKIDLTPNHDNIEGIEIDSSIPDKCFIKFIKANPRTSEFQSNGVREGLRRPYEVLQQEGVLSSSRPGYKDVGYLSNASSARKGELYHEVSALNSSKKLQIKQQGYPTFIQAPDLASPMEASPFSLYGGPASTATGMRTPTRQPKPTDTNESGPSLAGLELTQKYLISRFQTITDIYDSGKPPGKSYLLQD